MPTRKPRCLLVSVQLPAGSLRLSIKWVRHGESPVSISDQVQYCLFSFFFFFFPLVLVRGSRRSPPIHLSLALPRELLSSVPALLLGGEKSTLLVTSPAWPTGIAGQWTIPIFWLTKCRILVSCICSCILRSKHTAFPLSSPELDTFSVSVLLDAYSVLDGPPRCGAWGCTSGQCTHRLSKLAAADNRSDNSHRCRSLLRRRGLVQEESRIQQADPITYYRSNPFLPLSRSRNFNTGFQPRIQHPRRQQTG